MKSTQPGNTNLVFLSSASSGPSSGLSFGDVLQKYRKQAGLSQQDLADRMGTSRHTILNWESDKFKPSFDQTKDLCTALGIPIHELYGITGKALPTPHENELLQQYRRLTSANQRVMDKILSAVLSEQLNEQNDSLRRGFSVVPFQATPSAAGPGCEFNTVPPKPMFVKINSLSRRADTVIRVSGRSMEPLYCDGDLVYVKYCDTANEEDDVICSTADGAVIKRLRNHRLNSLNPDYPYAVKTDDDNVRIVGRVLGVVEPDDIPDEDDTRLLQDIFHDGLMEFYRKYGE